MLGIVLTLVTFATPQVPIDRHALVSRHNVKLTEFDGERPLQVGNGEFAFGRDFTGLVKVTPRTRSWISIER